MKRENLRVKEERVALSVILPVQENEKKRGKSIRKEAVEALRVKTNKGADNKHQTTKPRKKEKKKTERPEGKKRKSRHPPIPMHV